MADVAMDLHKRHSQVATLGQWGEIRELRIEHDGDSRTMEKFLGGLESGSRIAIEATGSWWWVVDLAEKHGHEVVLSNPKNTNSRSGQSRLFSHIERWGSMKRRCNNHGRILRMRPQRRLIQDQHMIQTLASDRAHEVL